MAGIHPAVVELSGGNLVLVIVVALLNLWRARPSFAASAFAANVVLMAAGFVLTGVIALVCAALRPHVKTHKTPQIVAMQVRRGITRCKCATIAEAEMSAAAAGSVVITASKPAATSSAPAMMPGITSGNVTRQNVCHSLA